MGATHFLMKTLPRVATEMAPRLQSHPCHEHHRRPTALVAIRAWFAVNLRQSAVGRSPHQKRFQTEKPTTPKKNDDPRPSSRSHEASMLPEGRFCATKTQ